MKIKLEKHHYQWGLMIFILFLSCTLAFFAIYRFDVIKNFFELCGNVLAPFIYGLVMAYLLCPVYNLIVSRTYRLMNMGKYKYKHDMTISKAVASILSIVLLLVVIAGVLWMIIPGLFNSMIKVVDILPGSMEQFTRWVDVKFERMPFAMESIDKAVSMFISGFQDFVQNTLLPQGASIATGVSVTLLGAIGAVVDFLIGIVICVYFLNIKDTLAAQAKKIIVANFNETTAEEILAGADYTNKTFGGFISGKIIDSIIIGIICFIVMTAFNWEYTLLISCIIGITNIIPFFGPFIGAIPSALLLLMVDPGHALGFIIFIVILQQFDGNILGPKILGGSIGLESFWVLFAILVGGGLFGFVGMVIGVPIFAIIYTYVSRSLNRKLRRKGFSINVSDYKVDKYRMKSGRKRKQKRRFSIEADPEELEEEVLEAAESLEENREHVRSGERTEAKAKAKAEAEAETEGK